MLYLTTIFLAAKLGEENSIPSGINNRKEPRKISNLVRSKLIRYFNIFLVVTLMPYLGLLGTNKTSLQL